MTILGSYPGSPRIRVRFSGDGGKAGTVGTTPAESAALNKLTANWRSLIEQPLAASEGGLFGERTKG